MAKQTCSVIISVFNEEGNLPQLYRELVQVAERESQLAWEFIFVDDGSRDNSHGILKALHAADPRVKVVRFSRNFGAHETTTAGLHVCSGDFAVIMGADLQEPPHVIHEFIRRQEGRHDVVMGVRASRQDPVIRKLTATVFNWIIRRIALPSCPKRGTGGFVLISRKVIDAYNSLKEKNRLTTGLLLWLGFTHVEVEYHRPPRVAGRTNWTFSKQIKTAIDTIMAFSYAPIRFMSTVGMIVAAGGFLVALSVLVQWLVSGTSVPGWASLMVAVLILGGVQLAAVGVLGEYLWRILEEVRDRPPYIVDEKLGDFGQIQAPERERGHAA